MKYLRGAGDWRALGAVPQSPNGHICRNRRFWIVLGKPPQSGKLGVLAPAVCGAVLSAVSRFLMGGLVGLGFVSILIGYLNSVFPVLLQIMDWSGKVGDHLFASKGASSWHQTAPSSGVTSKAKSLFATERESNIEVHHIRKLADF